MGYELRVFGCFSSNETVLKEISALTPRKVFSQNHFIKLNSDFGCSLYIQIAST